MPIKNPTQLLVEAASIPAKVEERLPSGAPKLSTMLVDTAGRLPVLPDLPMEIPDLPALPELPAMPGGGGAGLRVLGVDLTPVQRAREVVPSPAAGVLPERVQRRGF